MAYYYKLWDYLKKHNLSQNDLQRMANISQPTITKMRYNKSVSVSTLNAIVEALGCDFKDVVSVYPPKESVTYELIRDSGVDYSKLRTALQEYMKSNNFSPNGVALKTALSKSTVISFLNNNTITANSIEKLMTLEDFPPLEEFLL